MSGWGAAGGEVVGGAPKRAFDLAVGCAMILLLLPVLLLGALAVRLTSRGPVLYRARRSGVGGKVFEIWKFRSMRPARAGDARRITEADDARITAVGKIMRTTKVDEIPQLFNVVRGEMSIVGPRPEEEEVLVAHYPHEIRREILSARPGLTGLLQVRVFPDMTNEIIPEGVDPQEFYFRDQLPRRVAVDLDYVRRWTMGLDLAIIARTVALLLLRAPWIVLFGRRQVIHALPPVEDPTLLALFRGLARGGEGPPAPGGGA